MQHYYETKKMEIRGAGGDLSTSVGTWVDGERIIFGKLRMPAHTGASPHKHPNEQFIIVLEGRAKFEIDGDTKEVGKGEIIHIPPNTVHSAQVLGDQDMIFITAKDTSWGIIGMAPDAEMPK